MTSRWELRVGALAREASQAFCAPPSQWALRERRFRGVGSILRISWQMATVVVNSSGISNNSRR